MSWTCRAPTSGSLRRGLAGVLWALASLGGLAACDTVPTYTTADDRALDPVRQKYQACLKTQTQAVVNGSNDVQFLVHYVVAQCDGELDGVRRYLHTRGFTPPFIDNYVADVRQEATTVMSGVILRMKSDAVQPQRP